MSGWVGRFLRAWLKQTALWEIRRQGILAYIRAIKSTRQIVLTALLAALLLQLMMLSMVGALVTGFLLWNHDFEAKIEILFWIFAGTFSVPALLVCILLSETLWMRISGAKRLYESTRPNP